VKRRPVAGVGVRELEPAATSIVSTVSSMGEQEKPVIMLGGGKVCLPPMHANRGFGLTRRVPSIALAGFRMVWFATRMMSKPLRELEFCMNTETLSWLPTLPVIVAGLEGHELALFAIRQTVPVACPCASVIAGTLKRAAARSRIDEKSNAIFFKNYTCISRLPKTIMYDLSFPS
jgi:hypothetical protein